MFKRGSMVWVQGKREARVGLIIGFCKNSGMIDVRVAGHGCISAHVRRLRLMTNAAHVEAVMNQVISPFQTKRGGSA